MHHAPQPTHLSISIHFVQLRLQSLSRSLLSDPSPLAPPTIPLHTKSVTTYYYIDSAHHITFKQQSTNLKNTAG